MSNKNNARSMTLPRTSGNMSVGDFTIEEELAKYHSSTLPHPREREEDLPVSSTPIVEPLSEAIVEEERQNPDGKANIQLLKFSIVALWIYL